MRFLVSTFAAFVLACNSAYADIDSVIGGGREFTVNIRAGIRGPTWIIGDSSNPALTPFDALVCKQDGPAGSYIANGAPSAQLSAQTLHPCVTLYCVRSLVLHPITEPWVATVVIREREPSTCPS